MKDLAIRSVISSEARDWSDPRDGGTFSQSPCKRSNHESGISIPAFLQPLLGLDFVPYLPSSAVPSETSSRVMDDELQHLDSLPTRAIFPIGNQIDSAHDHRRQERTPGSVFPRSMSLGTITTVSDPNTMEPLAPPGEPSQEEETNDRQGNRRWSQRGGRLMHAVRGKIEKRRVKKDQRISRIGSWNGEGNVSFKARQNNETLEWIQVQNLRLTKHQVDLEEVQLEAKATGARANEIYERIGESQAEILRLHKALVFTEQRLSRDLKDFDDTKLQLSRLQVVALKASQALVESIQQMQGFDVSASDHTPTSDYRPLTSQASDLSGDSIFDDKPFGNETNHLVQLELSCTEPSCSLTKTTPSVIRLDSFMRTDDLEIPQEDVVDRHPPTDPGQSSKLYKRHDLMYIDNNITLILQNLCKLGYRVAVDESNRFKPVRDTDRILAKYSKMSFKDNLLDGWPVPSWKASHGQDILVWMGDIGHKGFGSDWPVIKARCLVDTSPRTLVEFMMDSSRVKEYNKMSQGREDLVKIQEGLDTTEAMSPYGFAGACKIVRSLNKPKLIPTTVETLSLTYSKPLNSAPGSYMTVTRSVFEDKTGEHKSPSPNTIRSETLLGVLIFRPANADHSVTEFTSVTHIYSPGVPEMLARRAAPSSAYNMMKDMQSVFLGRQR